MEKEQKIEAFKSGILIPESGYKYFLPEKVNREWTWHSPKLNHLLQNASKALGELNSFSKFIPNVDLFIHVYTRYEAVISSRIEGTQTTMDEALLTEDDIAPDRKDDWTEVQNYTTALNDAIRDLDKIPLSTRLIRSTHKTLLAGVRGQEKSPGVFRKSQNWIGGATVKDAVFIPPAHEYVNPLMGDLENFLHNERINVPELIKIGIAHYQFETIHPFLDGNGRIGRLIIPLYLVNKKIIDKPLLYLSSFYEKNKILYYDKLTYVREKNDMLQWLLYFLTGVETTAKQTVKTFMKVLELKEHIEKEININWGKRTKSAFTLLQYLFNNPAVRIKDAANVCKLSPRAAGQLVETFIHAGFLVEITKQQRNRIFYFRKYVNLFTTNQ
jgi:Fic family protein